FQKAHELGRLIGQTPEYQALSRARAHVGEDRELVARLNRLGELEFDVARALQEGRAPDVAIEEEYERLVSEVQASPAYQALVAGQANLDRILQKVNDEIAHGMEAGAKSRIILTS
ncbi:MAG TPA: YlbF family regulator, partial [Longimicrobiales bacterium]|nr:YlbF family regulator [Longimicrobiales bacterium]